MAIGICPQCKSKWGAITPPNKEGKRFLVCTVCGYKLPISESLFSTDTSLYKKKTVGKKQLLVIEGNLLDSISMLCSAIVEDPEIKWEIGKKFASAIYKVEKEKTVKVIRIPQNDEDLKYYHIQKLPLEGQLRCFNALGIHEALHIKCKSDIRIFDNFIKKYPKKLQKLAEDVLNIVEDVRIEGWAFRNLHPNILRDLLYYRITGAEEYFEPLDELETKWLTQIAAAALQLGLPVDPRIVEFNLILEGMQHLKWMGKILGKPKNKTVLEILQQIAKLFDWIRNNGTTIHDAVKVAEKIMEMLQYYADIKRKYDMKEEINKIFKRKYPKVDHHGNSIIFVTDEEEEEKEKKKRSAPMPIVINPLEKKKKKKHRKGAERGERKKEKEGEGEQRGGDDTNIDMSTKWFGKDLEQLKKDLSQFSQEEQEMIRKILSTLREQAKKLMSNKKIVQNIKEWNTEIEADGFRVLWRSVTQSDIEKYEKLKTKITPHIRSLVNNLSKIFTKALKKRGKKIFPLKRGKLETSTSTFVKYYVGKVMGKEERNIFYKNQPPPQVLTDAVFLLLIDLSSSMAWRTDMNRAPKIEYAQQAALLFAETLNALKKKFKVPLDFGIVGFQAVSAGVIENALHFWFKQFNEPYDHVRGRMATIISHVGGRNLDPETLRYCKRILSDKRFKDKQKFIIVITDGIPYSVRGKRGEDDAHEAVRECLNRGINVIGISIDDPEKAQGYLPQIYTGKTKNAEATPIIVPEIAQLPLKITEILKKILLKKKL